jgi:hypothetical protein
MHKLVCMILTKRMTTWLLTTSIVQKKRTRRLGRIPISQNNGKKQNKGRSMSFTSKADVDVGYVWKFRSLC